MEDDVIVEIQNDQGKRNFSLFRKNEEEESTFTEPDMKVPFNNRDKQKNTKTRSSSYVPEETIFEIENNLDEEASDE